MGRNESVSFFTCRLKLVDKVNTHRSVVNQVCYHQPSSRIASASRDHMIYLWRVSSSSSSSASLDLVCSFDKHLGNVLSLAFSQDGRFLFSGGSDNVVRLWDIENEQFVRHIETVQQQNNPQGDVVFLSASFEEGKLLTMSNDGFLRLYSVKQEPQDPVCPSETNTTDDDWMDLDALMAGQLDDFSKFSTVFDDLERSLSVCSVRNGAVANV